jgi:hypothetical protein
MDVDRSMVAPGQRVEVKDEVYFKSRTEAVKARESEQFYVYLLREFDYSVVERAMHKASPDNWWSLGDAEAIQVGQGAIDVRNSGIDKASASFTVPEVPPAKYHLMLCDAGCAEPLADNTIPARGFTVVADSATGQLAQRFDNLEAQVRSQGFELTAARRRADGARVAAQDFGAELDQLERRVGSLARDVRAAPGQTPWTYAGLLLAGALIGAAALMVLYRRMRRAPDPGSVRPISDEELREILDSEPVQPR